MDATNHWGLNEEQRAQLGWTADNGIWEHVTEVVWAEAEAARKVRPALPPLMEDMEESTNPNNIFDYSISDDPVLNIPSRQGLVAAELSSAFRISRPDQTGNAGVAKALAARTAHKLGVAEDAVLLLGAGARSFLRKLNVSAENLDQQSSRLIQQNQQSIGEKPILDSILEAIENLQSRGEFGGYRAIVAPDLYRQAFQPLENQFDSPIHQIRPLLVEDGFHYSQAVPKGKGVVISVGGGTICVTVPVKATVTWSGEVSGDIELKLMERFRLLVNVKEAVEPLGK